MVDEQKVAFAIIDFEQLIDELKTEGVINTEEHQEMVSMKNTILERCGFVMEE